MANQYTPQIHREDRACKLETCGKVFNVKKSKKTIYCSKDCAMRAIGKIPREIGEKWERKMKGVMWVVQKTGKDKYKWLHPVGEKPKIHKCAKKPVGAKWDICRSGIWYICEKLANGKIKSTRNEIKSPYVDRRILNVKPKPKKQHITDKQLQERKAKEARLSANLNNIPRPNEIRIKEPPIAFDGKIEIKVSEKLSYRIPPNKYTPDEIFAKYGVRI